MLKDLSVFCHSHAVPNASFIFQKCVSGPLSFSGCGPFLERRRRKGGRLGCVLCVRPLISEKLSSIPSEKKASSVGLKAMRHLLTIVCPVLYSMCLALQYRPSGFWEDVSYYGHERVREGDTFIITCFSATATNVSWTKDGQPVSLVLPDNSYSTSQHLDGSGFEVSTLLVNNAQKAYTGHYSCSNSTATVHRVTVYEREESSGSLAARNCINVVGNRSLELPCNIPGKHLRLSTVTWYKNGRSLVPTGRFALLGSTLVIHHAGEADAGTYACSLSPVVKDGVLKRAAVLHTVVTPIRVEAFAPIHQTRLGEGISFLCTASAIPKPKVAWYAGERRVDDSAVDAYDNQASQAALTFTSIFPPDAGVYTCVASHRHCDSLVARRSLQVYFSKTVMQTNEAYPGVGITLDPSVELLRLHCSYPAAPYARIRWMKGDKDTDDYSGLHKFSTAEKGQSLIIHNPTIDDVGNYTCIAQGTAGKAVILVGLKAAIQEESTPISALVEGNRAYMRCKVSGVPTPFVRWFKNNKLMKISRLRRFRYKAAAGVFPDTLEIENLARHDSGLYSCVADNGHSEDLKQFHLEVKTKADALLPFLIILAEVMALCVLVQRIHRQYLQSLEGIPQMEMIDGTKYEGGEPSKECPGQAAGICAQMDWEDFVGSSRLQKPKDAQPEVVAVPRTDDMLLGTTQREKADSMALAPVQSIQKELKPEGAVPFQHKRQLDASEDTTKAMLCSTELKSNGMVKQDDAEKQFEDMTAQSDQVLKLGSEQKYMATRTLPISTAAICENAPNLDVSVGADGVQAVPTDFITNGTGIPEDRSVSVILRGTPQKLEKRRKVDSDRNPETEEVLQARRSEAKGTAPSTARPVEMSRGKHASMANVAGEPKTSAGLASREGGGPVSQVTGTTAGKHMPKAKVAEVPKASPGLALGERSEPVQQVAGKAAVKAPVGSVPPTREEAALKPPGMHIPEASPELLPKATKATSTIRREIIQKAPPQARVKARGKTATAGPLPSPQTAPTSEAMSMAGKAGRRKRTRGPKPVVGATAPTLIPGTATDGQSAPTATHAAPPEIVAVSMTSPVKSQGTIPKVITAEAFGKGEGQTPTVARKVLTTAAAGPTGHVCGVAPSDTLSTPQDTMNHGVSHMDKNSVLPIWDVRNDGSKRGIERHPNQKQGTGQPATGIKSGSTASPAMAAASSSTTHNAMAPSIVLSNTECNSDREESHPNKGSPLRDRKGKTKGTQKGVEAGSHSHEQQVATLSNLAKHPKDTPKGQQEAEVAELQKDHEGEAKGKVPSSKSGTNLRRSESLQWLTLGSEERTEDRSRIQGDNVPHARYGAAPSGPEDALAHRLTSTRLSEKSGASEETSRKDIKLSPEETAPTKEGFTITEEERRALVERERTDVTVAPKGHELAKKSSETLVVRVFESGTEESTRQEDTSLGASWDVLASELQRPSLSKRQKRRHKSPRGKNRRPSGTTSENKTEKYKVGTMPPLGGQGTGTGFQLQLPEIKSTDKQSTKRTADNVPLVPLGEHSNSKVSKHSGALVPIEISPGQIPGDAKGEPHIQAADIEGRSDRKPQPMWAMRSRKRSGDKQKSEGTTKVKASLCVERTEKSVAVAGSVLGCNVDREAPARSKAAERTEQAEKHASRLVEYMERPLCNHVLGPVPVGLGTYPGDAEVTNLPRS